MDRDDDNNVGATSIPTRYNDHGRETIDLIRDALTDDQFIGYCQGNMIRYRSRAGKKGPSTLDEAKALWYEQMAAHVTDPTHHSDPRIYRQEGCQPYVRQPWTSGRYGVE